MRPYNIVRNAYIVCSELPQLDKLLLYKTVYMGHVEIFLFYIRIAVNVYNIYLCVRTIYNSIALLCNV